MNRRQFLIMQSLALSGITQARAQALVAQKVQTLDGALKWLDEMDKMFVLDPKGPRATGVWNLGAVLEHLAQSIEMSMNGFPEPKSAFFQNTVGAAAFTVFKWRGKMSHSLAEPIPGAPALNAQQPWSMSASRLRQSITSFQAYNSALKPHFAYGALSKTEFAQAHVFHIANHQDEIVLKA